MTEEPTVAARETNLETPDQSIDGPERKATESTPMPNEEEPEKKIIVFSPIGNVDETTNNTPETIKDDSQTKRTSFTERIAAMVRMKPKEKQEVISVTEKGKTFETVLAITTEAKQDEEQVTQLPTKTNKSWNQKQIHLSWANFDKVGTIRQKTETKRGRPSRTKKGCTAQQEREPRQLLCPGKGDGREAATDGGQSRTDRQRARETYQDRYGGNEEKIRHRE